MGLTNTLVVLLPIALALAVAIGIGMWRHARRPRAGGALVSQRGGLDAIPTPEDLATTLGRSLLVESVEKRIREDLQKIKEFTPAKITELLVQRLAAAQVGYRFELAYTQIWGSQLRLLQHLNAHPAGAPLGSLYSFYDQASRLFPQDFPSSSFESYIGFLASQGLIVANGLNVTISPTGREFLVYLVRTAKTFAKSY